MIRAFFVTFIALAYMLMVGTPILIYAAVSGNTDILYRVGRFGVRLVLWLSGVKLEVIGSDKTRTDRAVVFMSNHQSYEDDGIDCGSSLPPMQRIVTPVTMKCDRSHSQRLRGCIR